MEAMKVEPDGRPKVSKNVKPSMHADKAFAQKLRRRKGQMWRQMCVSYLIYCALHFFKFSISLFGVPLIDAFDISKFMTSERSSYMVSDVRKGHKLSEVSRLSDQLFSLIKYGSNVFNVEISCCDGPVLKVVMKNARAQKQEREMLQERLRFFSPQYAFLVASFQIKTS